MSSSDRKPLAQFAAIKDEKSISSLWHTLDTRIAQARVRSSLQEFRGGKPDRIFNNFPREAMLDERRYEQILEELYNILSKTKLVEAITPDGDKTGLFIIADGSKEREELIVWMEKVFNLGCDLLLDSRGNFNADNLMDFGWDEEYFVERQKPKKKEKPSEVEEKIKVDRHERPDIFDPKVMLKVLSGFFSYINEVCSDMFIRSVDLKKKAVEGVEPQFVLRGKPRPKLEADYFAAIGMVYNSYYNMSFRTIEIGAARLLKQGNFLLKLALEAKDAEKTASKAVDVELTRYITTSMLVEYLQLTPLASHAEASPIVRKEHELLLKLLAESEKEENSHDVYALLTKFYPELVAHDLKLTSLGRIFQKYIDMSQYYQEVIEAGIPDFNKVIGITDPDYVYKYLTPKDFAAAANLTIQVDLQSPSGASPGPESTPTPLSESAGQRSSWLSVLSRARQSLSQSSSPSPSSASSPSPVLGRHTSSPGFQAKVKTVQTQVASKFKSAHAKIKSLINIDKTGIAEPASGGAVEEKKKHATKKLPHHNSTGELPEGVAKKVRDKSKEADSSSALDDSDSPVSPKVGLSRSKSKDGT